MYNEKVILANNGDLLPEDAGALIAEDERLLEEAQAKMSALLFGTLALIVVGCDFLFGGGGGAGVMSLWHNI